MKRYRAREMALIVLFFALQCGGSGSSTGGTETGNTVGAAVRSIFSEESQNARLNKIGLRRLVSLWVRQARAQSAGSACEHLDVTPEGIITSAAIAPGTYGASSASVTVSATDDCEDGGEYASFFTSLHSMDCADSRGNEIIVSMVNSSGIWRENLAMSLTEVYGTFTMQSGETTVSDIRCSLTIGHGGGTDEFGGVCEDASGNAIEQSADILCREEE